MKSKSIIDQIRDVQHVAEARLEQDHADQRRQITRAANTAAFAVDLTAAWLDAQTQRAASRVRAAIAAARARGPRR